MRDEQAVPDDVEEALRLQDEALALLDRLRLAEPVAPQKSDAVGGGRRDFRRWPTPEGVTIELHDGKSWHSIVCSDMGVGGARVTDMPGWVRGPVPARLKAPHLGEAILVLADVMWQNGGGGSHLAGVRFEFLDPSERDQWSGALIDALLARHALN